MVAGARFTGADTLVRPYRSIETRCEAGAAVRVGCGVVRANATGFENRRAGRS